MMLEEFNFHRVRKQNLCEKVHRDYFGEEKAIIFLIK